MPLNFTFALTQQQTFELRCDYGSRRLDKTELAALIDLCEQNYYAQQKDYLPYLTQLGRQLYQWLDGNEGWLRRALDEADQQTIHLDLIKIREAQGLNPETERVALGLAHLPWELLHDGAGFLLQRQNISVLPVRSVQQRQTQIINVQNRPLRLLFMATSPEAPRVPPLGFEQEEANILQATKDQPLALIVEESGSVAELANLVKSYPEDYFDFEQNIPTANIEDGSLRMTADAYEILGAICAALAQNGAESRLIVTCRYLKEDTLPPHRLHLESLAGMSSSDIDKICFPLDKEVRQQLRTRRIIKIANGNPRLLKWLLEVIQQPGLAADELLNRLEKTEQKFRENILAQTLLDALEPEEQKFLARLSVFHLPVMEDIVRAISTAGELAVLGKLTSLSLVESATTHPNQPANYRVTTILEPLLEPVLSEEEWQVTRQQAVREVYQVWCKETNKFCADEEAIEIIRLGLLAEQWEIAIRVGDIVAVDWANNSRFLEALELCQQILAVVQDYRILGSIARAKYNLGLVEDALANYQQALDLCPTDDLKEKSIILSNMAWLIAQQGDTKTAVSYWQESLEIDERIGNDLGKGATLNNMAEVIARQGDIEQALSFWQESLKIIEHIGEFKDKATILNNMANAIVNQGDIEQGLSLLDQSLNINKDVGNILGQADNLANIAYVAGKTGDIPRQIELNLQAVELFAQVKAYGHMATVLGYLSVADRSYGLVYLAQAIWLSLQIQYPLADSIGLIFDLYTKVPKCDELKALLGTTAFYLCLIQDESYPKLQEFQIISIKMLLEAAINKGIDIKQAYTIWYVQQRLNDPEYFLPQLNQRLEEIVGDGWLFDRSQVSMGE
ncbi:MAG: tetratricopeptide repeat protein [Nostoc sp.]|uniref:CHAT domain-containing tetratricopeptide repeat protein n=1 Tax=Nostoc sp. TaxID=1180 RepID=UPI002FF94CEF